MPWTPARFRPGDPLPGIRPLAEELVINPNAVAKAYRALEDERVITPRHGVEAGRAFTHECAAISRAEAPRPAAERPGPREPAAHRHRLPTKSPTASSGTATWTSPAKCSSGCFRKTVPSSPASTTPAPAGPPSAWAATTTISSASRAPSSVSPSATSRARVCPPPC